MFYSPGLLLLSFFWMVCGMFKHWRSI